MNRVRALVLAGTLASISAAQAADDLTTLVTGLKHPRLKDGCVVFQEGQLAKGNLTIALGQGTACPIAANDTSIGWFYLGHARFRYVSRDPIELPVLKFNVKTEGRVDVVDAEGGVAITGTARTVLFASPGPLPALAGDPASAPADAFEEHLARLIRYDGTPMSHLLAPAILERRAEAPVRVEMDGGSGPLVYTFEPSDERTESLEILANYATSDREVRKLFRSATLSSQPVGRDRRIPVPPPFVMTAVDYELNAPGGDRVTIQAKTTVAAMKDGVRVLTFGVPGVILAWSGPGASSAREYRIVSVSDGSGTALPFTVGGFDVLVDAGKALPKGQPTTVVFHIEGNFLVRPNGDNYWILEGNEIFPQPPWSGRQYTMHGLIRVKKPFVALASGATIRRAEEGELNVLEVRSDLPTAVPVIIAGKYAFNEKTRDGLTVRVATYAGRNERSQEQLTELAFAMIRHMEHFLGSFPVPELNIVQVNDLGWGQAPLGTMLITNEAFDRMLPPEIAHFYTKGINERFAHEIAHQWWGHAIRWPNSDEVWLSESFAEYSAGLMVKRAQGKGVFDNLKASWRSRGKAASKVAPVALANQISTKDRATYFDHRFGLLYAKGPWLLARIHDQIGDEAFLTFLKTYQKTLKGKSGSTKLAADALRAVSGKDFAPFFEANFWGTSMPD